MKNISEDDIDVNNITISRKVIHLDEYDMYYVNLGMKDGSNKRVRVFCEKDTFPDLNSELFKNYQKNYSKELTRFFVKSLLGPDGLISKENRDDYIYLGGEFLRYGHIANRNIIQDNGKTGAENFEDKFFKIKMQVEAKEEQIQHKSQKDNVNNETGKHYAIGDIHGMYGSYVEAMKMLTPKDHVYILGDVIDRGNGGIKVLKDIISRSQNPKNNPKITFMMGNHEMQFMMCVSIMTQYGLHSTDLINIINRKNIKRHLEDLLSSNKNDSQIETYKQLLQKYEIKCKELMDKVGIDKYSMYCLDTWLVNNKGCTTIFNYLNCSQKEQDDIYSYLYDSYVVLPERIKNRDYLFVHAMPPKDDKMIRKMKETGEGYKISELSFEEYGFMLQSRAKEKSTYENAKKYGFTTICGHEAELGGIVRNKKKAFVRIDTGCGHNEKMSKLSLYCIEDDKVQYIDEKEEVNEISKE